MTSINRSPVSGELASLGALAGVCSSEALSGEEVRVGTDKAGRCFEMLLRGRNMVGAPKEELGSTPRTKLQPVVERFSSEAPRDRTDHCPRAQEATVRRNSVKVESEPHREPRANEVHSRRKCRLPAGQSDDVAEASKHSHGADGSFSGIPVEEDYNLECGANDICSYSEDALGREKLSEDSPSSELPYSFTIPPENARLAVGVGQSDKASNIVPNNALDGSGGGAGGALPDEPLDNGTASCGIKDLTAQSFALRASEGEDPRSAVLKDTFGDFVPLPSLGDGAGAAEVLSGPNTEFAVRPLTHSFRELLDLPPREQATDAGNGGDSKGMDPDSSEPPVGVLQENIAAQVSANSSAVVFKDTQAPIEQAFRKHISSDGISYAERAVHPMSPNWSFVPGPESEPHAPASARRVSAAHLVGELAAVRDGFGATSLNRCVVDFEVDGHGSLKVEIIRRSHHLEAVFRTDSEYLRDSLRSVFSSAEGLRNQLSSSSAQRADSGAETTNFAGHENGGDHRRQPQASPKSEGRFLASSATPKSEAEVVITRSNVADRLLHTFA